MAEHLSLVVCGGLSTCIQQQGGYRLGLIFDTLHALSDGHFTKVWSINACRECSMSAAAVTSSQKALTIAVCHRNEKTHQPRGLIWSSQDEWPAQRPELLRPQTACMYAHAVVNFRSTGMKQLRP